MKKIYLLLLIFAPLIGYGQSSVYPNITTGGGGGSSSTVNTTPPIYGDGSSGSHVRPDTGYHKGALGTYSLHQKDSIANALKQNKADTANNSVNGVMTNYDHLMLLYNTPAKNLTFSGVIDLTSHKSSNYNDYSISGTLSVTIASNPIDGSIAGIILIANGTNTPTFTGLYLSSGTWVNTNGTKNLLTFWQLGGHTYFSISQPAVQ
jgi:hypothetical protein